MAKIFDLKGYLDAQYAHAICCELNRHTTRVEHGCSDYLLDEKPELLVWHFIKNGGAEWFFVNYYEKYMIEV